MAKRKKAPHAGGRPARAEGASSNFVLRLSTLERASLHEFAERLGVSEAEAARTAIREAVHARFHDGRAPGCAMCEEGERATRGMLDAIAANAPAINAAIREVAREGAAMAKRAGKASKARKAAKVSP